MNLEILKMKETYLAQKKLYSYLEKSAIFHKANVDFIIGGPPCQTFSVVGRSRMGEAAYDDKRNYLFRYYCDIVNHFQPQFFLFENVPGILTANNGMIFQMIKEDFENIGYRFVSGFCDDLSDIRKNILSAYNFGVPQKRKRFIFLGIRNGVDLTYPAFDNIVYKNNTDELITKKVIDDLPFLHTDEGQDYGMMPYSYNDNLSTYQEMMREDSEGVLNHRARPLNKWYDREIYKLAICNAENSKILKYSELREALKTHKNQNHFNDRFKVHWWFKIPHTIVAHIAKDGHYNIHPDINQLRSITVREAARIQFFPDNFKFEDSRTAQFVQVGNAVPPLMAKAFAKKIREMCEDISANTTPHKVVN